MPKLFVIDQVKTDQNAYSGYQFHTVYREATEKEILYAAEIIRLEHLKEEIEEKLGKKKE